MTTTHEPYQTEYNHDERAEMLKKMKAAAQVFYAMASSTNVHPFLEITGFMNEYIKACERMHAAGKDFGTCSVQMKPYEFEYLAEKIDCIFGDALSDPENAEAFLNKMKEYTVK